MKTAHGPGDLRPRKRSLTLRGHRTSVSLEEPFWRGLLAEAARRGLSVNALVAEIDEARGLKSGLASAIRVYVLEAAQSGDAARKEADGSPEE